MYTAKIKNKNIEFGALKVWVEFTDGINSVEEWCIPQDEDGLKHWVKSRLAVFNGAPVLDAKYAINDEIDVADPVHTPHVPTAEEDARNTWLRDYDRWVKVKINLIDTGILTGNEAQVLALKDRVKKGFKPAYLQYL